MPKEIAKQPGIAQPAPTAGAQRIDFVVPVVNIHRSEDGFLLEMELPGVAKTGVDLTVADGKLVITGHRNRTDPSGQGRTLHREIGTGDYRRVFDLDPSIDPEKISAKMDQGLLRVHLHKAEQHKPRKISVN